MASDGGPALVSRPAGNNADEWAVFLEEYGATSYAAVQIAEAIDDAEKTGAARAVDRMGWPEINAFHEDMARGQSIYEDAGGFMLRCIRRLFGLPPLPDREVVTYQEAARAMLRAREGKERNYVASAPSRIGESRLSRDAI